MINKIRYLTPNSRIPLELEEWMLFGYYLGKILKEHETSMNIYLSVPNNLLISYFIVLGSVNHDFSMKDDAELREIYLSLKKGNRVLYLDDAKWKSCYVYNVEKHPQKENLMVVKILSNKKTIIYVPENRWLTHLRILNQDVTESKNARVMNNVSQLDNNKFLTYFYEKKNINRCEIQNQISATVITNQREWLNSLEDFNITSPVGACLLNEFIHTGYLKTYKNVQIISSRHSNLDNAQNYPNELIIFLGANRSLTKMDRYLQSKRIFIVDRHESKESIDNLKEKIEYEFINNTSKCLNHILIDKLSEFGYEVPKGVEVFVWE